MDKGHLLEIALEGNTAAENGNFLQAVANYSTVINAWPSEYSFLVNRTLCYMKMDFYFLAFFDINKAFRLVTEERLQAKCLFIRSRILRKLKQHEHSTSDLLAASHIDPYNEELAQEIERACERNKENYLFKDKLKGYNLQDKSYYKVKVNFHLVQAANLPTNMWNYEGVRVEGIRLGVSLEVIRSYFSLFGDIVAVRRLGRSACTVFVYYDNPVTPMFTIAYFQQRIEEELSVKVRGLFKPLQLFFAPTDAQTDLKFSRPKYPLGNSKECYFWRTTSCNHNGRCSKLHIPANKNIDTQIWMKHK